jgi:FkbM family methyltransferase
MKNLSTGKGYGQKIHFLKSLIMKTESVLKTDYAETWGGKIHVHNDDTGSLSTLSISGVFGPRDTQTVKDNVFSGNIVVDLGANIGYFTCLLAKIVGEGGKVFAFEPDPRNLKLLRRNIQENDYKNVIIADKAVSDVNGSCTLYSSQKKFGANRIFESKNKQTHDFIPIKSETICLDDYFEKQNLLKKIDFIKIDVEGSEFRAFNGMKKILELNNNLKIFTEIAPSLLEDAGSSGKQVLDFLQEHKFINFFISDNRKNTLSKITKNELLIQLEQLHIINILCTK